MADTLEPRFLLASLHIEAILRGTTVARRRKTLKSIKDGAGLGDVYGATLERIKAQDEEKAKLAMATLTWVCHSERPLQVDELCHALAVEIGETDFDPENVPAIGSLLDCCQGLITVDAEASTVRLIHYTVQQYLCSYPSLFTKPHSTLAETCLTYLNSQQVKNLPSRSLPPPQSMPFLRYSARYWGIHTNKDLSDHARTLSLEHLNQYEHHISAVSLLDQVLDPRYTSLIAPSPLFSRLHCASFFGIVELVTILIKAEGYKINQQDCTGGTPLTWGAINGHEGVVELLLEREDVDPNCPDKDDRTPLSWAASGGNEGVVKLLLEREFVDPNLPDKHDGTPLLWAANKGYEGVVKLLLERQDIDPNYQDNNDRTPLLWAVNRGHEGVVKLLLEREDVDPNCPDNHDSIPLRWAVREGYEGVVRLLLEREDVDPNRPDKDDLTPLSWAVTQGHEGVVKLLLEREDIDPNLPDKDDRTPLMWAVNEGHEGVVRLLLGRKDIDPNYPEKDGQTPLRRAASLGHEGVVRLLLERQDVDPNYPDKDNRVPLWWAAGKVQSGQAIARTERYRPQSPGSGWWNTTLVGRW